MYRYWGKADEAGHHLLVYHCLDVAAAMRAIFDGVPLFRARAQRLADMPSADIEGLLLFFAALHDLGKFSGPFQSKRPELVAALGGALYRRYDDSHHTKAGLWVFENRIFHDLSADASVPFNDDHFDALQPLMAAAFGHHGKPVSIKPDEAAPGAWVGHAGEFACAATRLFLPHNMAIPDEEEHFNHLSWFFAGLCVLADWIGSSLAWFPMCAKRMELGDYFERVAMPQARRVVAECGLCSPGASAAGGFHALLPHLGRGARPTALQRYAMGAVRRSGPQLHIFEDLTGGGKTEAALLCAHALMRQGEAEGMYVALPTMATANGMYGRMADSYKALFEAASGRVSLVLAHGGRGISEAFLSSLGSSAPDLAAGAVADDEDEQSEAYCVRWLADNAKKSLLSPCGVGTIDQALLAVLHSRHQSLRLLGLCRSVLLIDEAHAYDAYTSTVLKALLEFHAALGGSAVLLSATLPLLLRRELVAAFCKGAGYALPELREAHFPLATRVDGAGASEEKLPKGRALDVAVALTSEEEALFAELMRVREAGGCACWIRNTVDQAVAAYERICRTVPEDDVLLFHARFAMCDRLRIEESVKRLFGKESDPQERRGKILIATQVVEQSLDLDFDFLASDLAPMELLIQRAGRCHRHERIRPQGLERARMLVLSPEPVAEAGAEWYASVCGKARYVYPVQAVLWRTAGLLAERGRILLPEEARELVEGAYDESVIAPKVFEEADAEAVGELLAKKTMGKRNVLDVYPGYGDMQDLIWVDEERTPTRLGEESVQVRLVRVDGKGMRLFSGEGVGKLACAMSEARVSARRLGEVEMPEGLSERLEAFRAGMPDGGRWRVLYPLSYDAVRGVWTGLARTRRGVLGYSEQTGLRYVEG